MSVLALLFAFAAAPAAPAPAPAPPPALDCAGGFASLVAAAKRLPGANVVEPPAGSTMQAVSVQDGELLTVYNFTLPGNAAHPFFTRRRIVNTAGRLNVDMSSCPYGDPAQGAQLEAQFRRMNDAFLRQISTPSSQP